MNAPGEPRAPATRLELTGSGRVALLLALGAGVLAATGPGLARPLAALVAAALLLAAELAARRARALELAAPRPARAPVGTRLELDFPVRARGAAQGPELLLALSERAEESPLPAGLVAGMSVAFSARLAWRVRRRGRLTRLVAWVSASDPLGLVRATRRHELTCDVLGLPRRGTLAPELTRAGTHRAALRGRAARGDEEFVTVRDWRAGESLRRVHWRLSARRGRAIVRELAAPAESDVIVTLEEELDEPTRRARRAAFERAVSLAATLAQHHMRAGRRLTLVLGGEVAARGLRGRGGLARALALLAEVEPRGPRAAPLAPAQHGRSGAGWIVRAGAQRATLAAPAGTRVLDVDAPHGHPHHAAWSLAASRGDAR